MGTIFDCVNVRLTLLHAPLRFPEYVCDDLFYFDEHQRAVTGASRMRTCFTADRTAES